MLWTANTKTKNSLNPTLLTSTLSSSTTPPWIFELLRSFSLRGFPSSHEMLAPAAPNPSPIAFAPSTQVKGPKTTTGKIFQEMTFITCNSKNKSKM
ncbi:hypothetical protein E2542_SST05685 [Spatholobus suberectus]|nr:hypothetical protein E2542_SST05685 [Spatholobus suberectus]